MQQLDLVLAPTLLFATPCCEPLPGLLSLASHHRGTGCPLSSALLEGRPGVQQLVLRYWLARSAALRHGRQGGRRPRSERWCPLAFRPLSSASSAPTAFRPCCTFVHRVPDRKKTRHGRCGRGTGLPRAPGGTRALSRLCKQVMARLRHIPAPLVHPSGGGGFQKRPAHFPIHLLPCTACHPLRKSILRRQSVPLLPPRQTPPRQTPVPPQAARRPHGANQPRLPGRCAWTWQDRLFYGGG